MVFRRRDTRPFLRFVLHLLYPPGGWFRAFHYVRHRLRRLPDTPDRIARGIWAGVFTTFTPFYGLHFFIAAFLAFVMRGNVLAALMATFFGNPLTYVPIGVISLSTGHWLLGSTFDEVDQVSFGRKFVDAGRDLKDNVLAIFTDGRADWHRLELFYHDIFYPYLVGGLIPGAVAGTLCYYVSLPLIRAYQKRRRTVIKAKFEAIRRKAEGDDEAS